MSTKRDDTPVEVTYDGNCKDFILKLEGVTYSVPSTKYKEKAKASIPKWVYERYSDKLSLATTSKSVSK